MVSLPPTVEAATSESCMCYNNLTAQNQQLWAEKTSLERRTEELTRERDALNWTVGVILEYDNFSVNSYCSQKGENVYKMYVKVFPKREQSYLFSHGLFRLDWACWAGSRQLTSVIWTGYWYQSISALKSNVISIQYYFYC